MAVSKQRWASEQTRKIISAAVLNNWSLVSKFHDASEDDLIQHFTVLLAEQEEAKFDAWWERTGRHSKRANENGAWSNFVNMLIRRRMLDMRKTKNNGGKRIAEHLTQWEWSDEGESDRVRVHRDPEANMDINITTAGEEFEADILSDTSEGDESLFEWTRGMYLHAKRRAEMPTDVDAYNPAQLAVCGMLMMRLGEDARGMIRLLNDRKDLRLAMDLDLRDKPTLPKAAWFDEALLTVMKAAASV